MLQSLDFRFQKQEDIMLEKNEETGILSILFQGEIVAQFLELQNGIYETNSLNADMYIDILTDFEVIEEKSYSNLVDENTSDGYRFIQSFGVCDNFEQILNYVPEVVTRNNIYVIFITRIRKEDQPKHDGWRWLKWGEYIGIQNSTAEYLYNELFIDEIFVYGIFEIEPKKVHLIK